MLDRRATDLLRPALVAVARALARIGVKADKVTLFGFAVGIDGALARLTAASERGGFLDITLDFLFYAAIPLAFAFADPATNALPAAVLLAAFIGTATTFLAFAALAAQRGLKSVVYPDKGLYYLGGLTEAGETLACFALMCLWPAHFALWAYGFAVLCALTIVMRLWTGWKALAP